VTYRVCLGLQQSDRAVLDHGIGTGIVRRLPHGGYVEAHRPPGGLDGRGDPIRLEYAGAPVPKRLNQVGAAGPPAR
jgi:ubiquinol-cytochrome c reductase cytochrome b subunit